MFPKVISDIINDYYDNDRIILNYELTYPYYNDDFIPIMLSINHDKYKFNHNIYIGYYNMHNIFDCTHVNMIPGKIIDTTIIDEYNLNVCIEIHMVLYDLLKNVQQIYRST